MKLAMRGTCLSNHLWVREVRKLTERGHQTAILATDYRSNIATLATHMFSRWSPENFFKYMRENFNLDRLIDYSIEPISDPVAIVNPRYRALDGQIRSLAAKLSRRLAKFGAMNLKGDIEPARVEQFVENKATLQEEIETFQTELGAVKTCA